eukprot:IDg17225t1
MHIRTICGYEQLSSKSLTEISLSNCSNSHVTLAFHVKLEHTSAQNHNMLPVLCTAITLEDEPNGHGCKAEQQLLIHRNRKLYSTACTHCETSFTNESFHCAGPRDITDKMGQVANFLRDGGGDRRFWEKSTDNRGDRGRRRCATPQGTEH